jgi:hypothetical protein
MHEERQTKSNMAGASPKQQRRGTWSYSQVRIIAGEGDKSTELCKNIFI